MDRVKEKLADDNHLRAGVNKAQGNMPLVWLSKTPGESIIMIATTTHAESLTSTFWPEQRSFAIGPPIAQDPLNLSASKGATACLQLPDPSSARGPRASSATMWA